MFTFVVSLEPNSSYKTPGHGNPAAPAQTSGPQAEAAGPVRLHLAALQAPAPLKHAWGVVYLTGPGMEQRAEEPVTIEIWDDESGKFLDRRFDKSSTIRLRVPPGLIRLVVSKPGFRIAEVRGRRAPGTTSSFRVPLEPAWAPIGVQSVLKGVLGYEQGRRLSPVSLELDQIRVHEDGEAGRATWRFEVLVNDGVVLRIPDQAYTDREPPAKMNVPPAQVPLPPNALLRVLGYRPSSVQGSLTLPADFGGASLVSHTVPLTALNGRSRDGDFRCRLSLSRSPSGTVRLRFDEIQVNEDGAPGAVGWLFEVFLGDRSVFRLPRKLYTDDIGRYVYSTADRPEGSFEAPSQGQLSFRILGYRDESVDGFARLPSELTVPVYRQTVRAVGVSGKQTDGDFEFVFLLSKPQTGSIPVGDAGWLRAFLRRSAPFFAYTISMQSP